MRNEISYAIGAITLAGLVIVAAIIRYRRSAARKRHAMHIDAEPSAVPLAPPSDFLGVKIIDRRQTPRAVRFWPPQGGQPPAARPAVELHGIDTPATQATTAEPRSLDVLSRLADHFKDDPAAPSARPGRDEEPLPLVRKEEVRLRRYQEEHAATEVNPEGWSPWDGEESDR